MKIKELLNVIKDHTEIRITTKNSRCCVNCRPNDGFVLALKELEIEEIKPPYEKAEHYIDILLKEETSNEQQPFTEKGKLRSNYGNLG